MSHGSISTIGDIQAGKIFSDDRRPDIRVALEP